MCEVNKDNFEAVLPSVQKAIKDAVFVAFDCEFTGLYKSSTSQPSFLDSSQDRYTKLREAATNFTICQIGLSAFKYDGKNRYVAETYNFYLYPSAFGPIDNRIMIQTSSTEFLSSNNFDFNKVFYKGIPFLNKQQETLLQTRHKKRSIVADCSGQFIDRLNDLFITETCKDVEHWLRNTSDLTLDVPRPESGITEYIFLSMLERKFLSKFSYNSLPSADKIRLTRFSKDETPGPDYLEAEFQRIIKSHVGFTTIMQLLSELKKPIVGHNSIADLVFIFQKFHKQLPSDYTTFKSELHEFLPHIYDTKFIATRMREVFNDTEFFKATRLQDLYTSLDSHAAKFRNLHSPDVRHGENTAKYVGTECPHEAGYDSFTTGYVLIRMAHFLAMKDMNSSHMRPMLPEEHLESLQQYENCVIVAKFLQKYMNLAGKDPPPDQIIKYYVTAKNGKTRFLPGEVANEFAVFGSVDVRIISNTEAIVALGFRKRSANVERAFTKHKHYKVVKYSRMWHSKEGKIALWIGGLTLAAVTLGGIGMLLKSNFTIDE